MKVNIKLICSGLIIMLCLGIKFVDGAIDPDSAILSALQTSCGTAAISSADSTTLGTMLTVLNNAKTLYSNPDNTVDLGVIAPLISQAQARTGTTPTTPTTPTAPATIDQQITNAITVAMSNSTIAGKISALNSIATNSAYKNAKVLASTQTAFATAIMAVGGTYINNKLSALVAFYTKIYNEIKAIKTLSAKEKVNIKNTIAPYIINIGGNIGKFNQLLTNSLNTKLLTGPKTAKKTQMYFVNTTLIPALNLLNYLNSKA